MPKRQRQKPRQRRPVPKGGTRAVLGYPFFAPRTGNPPVLGIKKIFLRFVRDLAKESAKSLAKGLGPKWRWRMDSNPRLRRTGLVVSGQRMLIASVGITLIPPPPQRV